MISGGDERMRTQRGNNNAYCQDNELSWYDWGSDEQAERFRDFVRRVIAIRKEHAVLRRRSFLEGRASSDVGAKDIYWVHPEGREMADADWTDPSVRALGALLTGEAVDGVDDKGRRMIGDTLLIAINGHDADVEFALAGRPGVRRWERLLDTAHESRAEGRRRLWRRNEPYRMIGRSMAVFRSAPARGPAS